MGLYPMKPYFLLSLLLPLPATAAVNLQAYSHANTYNLPAQATEISAIAYNGDTGTLFAIGDEGGSILEFSKSGQLLSSMTIAGQYTGVPSGTSSDTEGITYLGNGRFAYAEERLQTAYGFTYTAGSTLQRGTLTSYHFSTTVGNIGLEGITYDPLTDSLWGVKEKQPRAIYQMTNIIGSDTSIVITNPFSLANINLFDFADIYAVANSAAFFGGPDQENFLLLSQESNMLIEIDRTGNVISSLDLGFLGRTTIEGVTMDDEGNIYLTAEETGPGDSPQLFVLATPSIPEPSSFLIGAFSMTMLACRRRK